MHRHLFNLAAGVSCVLCLLTAALWALSFGPLKGDHHGAHRVFVSEGKLWVGHVFGAGEAWRGTEFGWNIRVASHYRLIGDRGGRWTSTRIELWCIALLFAVLPAIAVRQRARAARSSRAGLCPTCDYDCRGPAEGTLLARCPECGTDLPPSKPATLAPVG